MGGPQTACPPLSDAHTLPAPPSAMHAMPAVAMHPSGEAFVGQSMDNSLQVYWAGDRVRRGWGGRGGEEEGGRQLRGPVSLTSRVTGLPAPPLQVGLNRKKKFTGHITAGFACRPAFSPNGQVLAMGGAGRHSRPTARYLQWGGQAGILAQLPGLQSYLQWGQELSDPVPL